VHVVGEVCGSAGTAPALPRVHAAHAAVYRLPRAGSAGPTQRILHHSAPALGGGMRDNAMDTAPDRHGTEAAAT
jgi:hypothetical protein